MTEYSTRPTHNPRRKPPIRHRNKISSGFNSSRDGDNSRKKIPLERVLLENAEDLVKINLDKYILQEERELLHLAEEFNITEADSLRKAALIFTLFESEYQENLNHTILYSSGTLEILSEGYGFLRSANYSYLPGPDDLYITASQVKALNLRTGDFIAGKIRSPKDNERFFALDRIETINNIPARESIKRLLFDKLKPLYPKEKFILETLSNKYSCRVIDMMCPIGKGQRGLIVSPPRVGKTILMQDIANSITTNNPEAILIVLLIDERPEEVTDMEFNVKGEVVSSTFDEPASRHVQIADMVIAKAKRLVEQKHDVVILLDSITRLARAYNQVIPSSGKVLSGGVDSNALHKPKRFFGSARNLQESGSLTIIATALIDTGSKMDEVIFEEFKGTGNMEVYLDRKLAEKRVFPAIDINKSGTRKENLLQTQEDNARIWLLRKALSPLSPVESMELLLSKMRGTKTNKNFLDSMQSS